MSKKHNKTNQNQTAEYAVSTHTAEYRIIKHDLVKVVVLNSIYLAAVLAIYYSNLRAGYLEHWFSKILHF
jgi:hypothetical protein